jgi:NAD(P)-dependent dehydrogenase (short-subunit alcohol dehydrogenase family)
LLASSDAAWITGHTLPVDGGLMTGARPEFQGDWLP